jgi:hypothetical protein
VGAPMTAPGRPPANRDRTDAVTVEVRMGRARCTKPKGDKRFRETLAPIRDSSRDLRDVVPMARRPLDPTARGKAPVIATRMGRSTVAQLEQLAKRRGISRGLLIREMVEAALEQERSSA